MKRRTQKGRKQKGAKGCWSGKTRFRDKSSALGALRNVKGSGVVPVRAPTSAPAAVAGTSPAGTAS